MSLSRRGFLQTAAGTALAQLRRRPNVVFFIFDDLGYGDLGCYGQQHIQTPNVDRVAREGMRFSDAYAGGSVCAPSRSCLMTGLHTGHTPVRANAGTVPLRDEDVTLAEVLKKAGYASGGFGKWGLGDARTPGAPTRQGFDEFVGYYHQMHAHSYYPEYLWDGEKRLDLKGNAGGARREYSADLIAERSFDFLRRHHDAPFFLYCCYTLPHARFEAPDVKPYEDRPWPEGHKTYASMVTRADRYLGRLTGLLKDLRLEDNTLLVVTSDNGAHFGAEKGFEFFRSNGALRGQKGEFYEGGIRVPMLARWPGRVPAGRVSAHPWAFWDVLPTLCDVSGAETPRGIDGRSVWPVMQGKAAAPAPYLYWEDCTYNRQQNRVQPAPAAQAARMGRWKAVRPKRGAAIEIYDLATDISETKNLAVESADAVARAETIFREARTEPRPHDNGVFEWAK
jgi:arylsulfatase A-like enzyme